MQVLKTIADMRQACSTIRFAGETLGLVPTMGALHEGHLSLVRASRQSCDRTAATIFVNPLQFGPNEDFSRYPRTFEQDCTHLEAEGVDLLFAPTPEEMYPPNAHSFVEIPGIGDRLDGASRPGHFRGVATVVAKLFHIVGPNRAFFGQKDAAQVAVLRAMVRDLNFPLDLVVCPTVRDADGLALSSRNRYLSKSEREQALALSRSLQHVQDFVTTGERVVSTLRSALLQQLQNTGQLRIDYAEFVHPNTLEPVSDLHSGALVAVAAWSGNTRLIDNIVIPAQARRPA